MFVQLENRDEFRPFFIESLERYVKSNSRVGQWAGSAELYALSKLYKRRIEVYQEDEFQQPSFVMSEEFVDSDVMRLSYEGQSHYNVVYDVNEHARRQ